MTNPQIERMAEAIKNVGYKHVKHQYCYTIERKFNEEAQAAYDASDARFVPMLVEALKIAAQHNIGFQGVPREVTEAAKKALAQLPEGYL